MLLTPPYQHSTVFPSTPLKAYILGHAQPYGYGYCPGSFDRALRIVFLFGWAVSNLLLPLQRHSVTRLDLFFSSFLSAVAGLDSEDICRHTEAVILLSDMVLWTSELRTQWLEMWYEKRLAQNVEAAQPQGSRASILKSASQNEIQTTIASTS